MTSKSSKKTLYHKFESSSNSNSDELNDNDHSLCKRSKKSDTKASFKRQKYNKTEEEHLKQESYEKSFSNDEKYKSNMERSVLFEKISDSNILKIENDSYDPELYKNQNNCLKINYHETDLIKEIKIVKLEDKKESENYLASHKMEVGDQKIFYEMALIWATNNNLYEKKKYNYDYANEIHDKFDRIILGDNKDFSGDDPVKNSLDERSSDYEILQNTKFSHTSLSPNEVLETILDLKTDKDLFSSFPVQKNCERPQKHEYSTESNHSDENDEFEKEKCNSENENSDTENDDDYFASLLCKIIKDNN